MMKKNKLRLFFTAKHNRRLKSKCSAGQTENGRHISKSKFSQRYTIHN